MPSLNLYSIRPFLGTFNDADEALRRVSAAGYRAVEPCLMPGMPDVGQIRALCDRHGLAVCGLHAPAVLDHPGDALRSMEVLGCGIVSYPYPAGRDLAVPAEVARLAADLQRAGEWLARRGKVLTYHHHHLEFVRTGGVPVLDQLFARTDPAWVQAELDIYWIQYGGCDPAQWCRRLAGRLPQIHLKDYCIGSDGKPRSCALGRGNLDLDGIVAAARAAGCRRFIVEQEHFDADPFAELEEALRLLVSLPSWR